MAIPTKKPRSNSGSGAGIIDSGPPVRRLIRGNDDRAHSLRGANDANPEVVPRGGHTGNLVSHGRKSTALGPAGKPGGYMSRPRSVTILLNLTNASVTVA